MAEAPELYRIIRRREITYARGTPREFIQQLVTYQAPGLAPYTLFIPKPEWDPEREKALILADIERRKKEKPEVVRG